MRKMFEGIEPEKRLSLRSRFRSAEEALAESVSDQRGCREPVKRLL